MYEALVPGMFADSEEWVEAELASVGAPPIRLEGFREKDKYVRRPELPGVDPNRDVTENVDHGVIDAGGQAFSAGV